MFETKAGLKLKKLIKKQIKSKSQGQKKKQKVTRFMKIIFLNLISKVNED